jgi:hypothetical protein
MLIFKYIVTLCANMQKMYLPWLCTTISKDLLTERDYNYQLDYSLNCTYQCNQSCLLKCIDDVSLQQSFHMCKEMLICIPLFGHIVDTSRC